jgi:hypothetical protein
MGSMQNDIISQFLDRIVTADEILVHHYEPECKALSVA